MAMHQFLREQAGAAMVELTIVAALLLTLVLGFVDFGYAFYQWNAATKAVQVGARLAAVSAPVAAGVALEAGIPANVSDVGETVPAGQFHYRCTADAADVVSCTCVSGTCADLTSVPTAFDLIFNGDATRSGMVDFFPALEKQNVQIEYVATGLGYWTRAGGPVPTIRVSIENHQFQFFFLSGLLGFANITMPNMLSTITGEDLCTLGTTC
jgi:Flp pilus assembly pilin Flp